MNSYIPQVVAAWFFPGQILCLVGSAGIVVLPPLALNESDGVAGDVWVAVAAGVERKKRALPSEALCAEEPVFTGFLLVSDLLFDHLLFHLLRLSVDEGGLFDPDAA